MKILGELQACNMCSCHCYSIHPGNQPPQYPGSIPENRVRPEVKAFDQNLPCIPQFTSDYMSDCIGFFSERAISSKRT